MAASRSKCRGLKREREMLTELRFDEAICPLVLSSEALEVGREA